MIVTRGLGLSLAKPLIVTAGYGGWGDIDVVDVVPPSGLGFPYRPRPRPQAFDFQEADQQWLIAVLAQMIAARLL
jgi:hypothetical protein